MSVIFVSRHPGAEMWVRQSGLSVDRWETHLNVDAIREGDFVVGVLPVALASEVCQRRATFVELAIATPEHLRGKELTFSQLVSLGAKLRCFKVEECPLPALPFAPAQAE